MSFWAEFATHKEPVEKPKVQLEDTFRIVPFYYQTWAAAYQGFLACGDRAAPIPLSAGATRELAEFAVSGGTDEWRKCLARAFGPGPTKKVSPSELSRTSVRKLVAGLVQGKSGMQLAIASECHDPEYAAFFQVFVVESDIRRDLDRVREALPKAAKKAAEFPFPQLEEDIRACNMFWTSYCNQSTSAPAPMSRSEITFNDKYSEMHDPKDRIFRVMRGVVFFRMAEWSSEWGDAKSVTVKVLPNVAPAAMTLSAHHQHPSPGVHLMSPVAPAAMTLSAHHQHPSPGVHLMSPGAGLGYGSMTGQHGFPATAVTGPQIQGKVDESTRKRQSNNDERQTPHDDDDDDDDAADDDDDADESLSPMAGPAGDGPDRQPGSADDRQGLKPHGDRGTERTVEEQNAHKRRRPAPEGGDSRSKIAVGQSPWWWRSIMCKRIEDLAKHPGKNERGRILREYLKDNEGHSLVASVGIGDRKDSTEISMYVWVLVTLHVSGFKTRDTGSPEGAFLEALIGNSPGKKDPRIVSGATNFSSFIRDNFGAKGCPVFPVHDDEHHLVTIRDGYAVVSVPWMQPEKNRRLYFLPDTSIVWLVLLWWFGGSESVLKKEDHVFKTFFDGHVDFLSSIARSVLLLPKTADMPVAPDATAVRVLKQLFSFKKDDVSKAGASEAALEWFNDRLTTNAKIPIAPGGAKRL